MNELEGPMFEVVERWRGTEARPGWMRLLRGRRRSFVYFR